MPSPYCAIALTKSSQHGFICQNIDQPRNTSAGKPELAQGAWRKQRVTLKPCSLQSVIHVVGHLLTAQSREPIAENNALTQLTLGVTGQTRIEFRLTEKHDMQQFAFFGFEIAQQPQRFKCMIRHGLRLVDT